MSLLKTLTISLLRVQTSPESLNQNQTEEGNEDDEDSNFSMLEDILPETQKIKNQQDELARSHETWEKLFTIHSSQKI